LRRLTRSGRLIVVAEQQLVELGAQIETLEPGIIEPVVDAAGVAAGLNGAGEVRIHIMPLFSG
jgi:hypothetical protein